MSFNIKRIIILSFLVLTVARVCIGNGNRVAAIDDAAGSQASYLVKEYQDLSGGQAEFAYDANGNMLHDLDRDIVTVRYNLLNLPDTVQFRDGRQILNKYTADGTRLASTYYTPTHITVQPLSIGEVADYHSYPQYLLDRVRTWFVDNKEYGLMYPEHYDYLELKKVYTDEGYVTTNGQSDNCDYHYYRRDHLGNVREVWKPSGDSTLTVQRTRYYPSGLPWEYQAGDSASLQPYKYGGKEFVETHGLDMYDSHARWYDPRIIRTTSPDPLAEKYYDTSPYAWCGNNPVNWIDPDGRDWYEDENGNAMWRRSKDEKYQDDEGRIWENIGTEYLLFDGSNLHYFQQEEDENGVLTLSMNSYGAVSGRAQEDGTFNYSEERQSERKTGPIPAGLYSINPQNIQNYNDLNILQKGAAILKKGPFPGGTIAWGENRVWISPSVITVVDPQTKKSIVRTNMSIHGGLTPGSAGCIDLHRNASAFFENLIQSNSSFVRLRVLYNTK